MFKEPGNCLGNCAPTAQIGVSKQGERVAGPINLFETLFTLFNQFDVMRNIDTWPVNCDEDFPRLLQAKGFQETTEKIWSVETEDQDR